MKYSDRISFNKKYQSFRVYIGGRHSRQVYFSFKKYGNHSNALDAAMNFEKELPNYERRGRCNARKKAIDYREAMVKENMGLLDQKLNHA